MENLQTMVTETDIANEKETTMKEEKKSRLNWKNLRNKKGFNDLVMALVLLAVLAGLAFTVLPQTMGKVTQISGESNTKLESLTNIFGEDDGN